MKERRRLFDGKPLPLGDAMAAVIHAGVDVLPIPKEIKGRVKNCGGCGRRREALNRIVPNINPYADSAPPQS